MLQVKDIKKQYKTGNLVQKALDGVSLNLRDNEFVAILGPSGSGKTTLLNIIGGLDRYDSGDLIINGISTKKYKDRDWDSYRNHTIGFVFQSYNLIPHQTILANVELALTISGIGKSKRKEKAIEALKKVGLGEQLHKRPNQLSGGQMQRVAIARALVNDPDILLADEPTGALDSETSIQVMDLLKEVAKDRLVVMVTHNPELAEEYATRIVKLKDGKIRSDSQPYFVDEATLAEPEHRNMGKASMSFLTALSLSFNNLKTKKGRTFLTSFAGSIGIIGIALILSLSAGVSDYIKNIERETLSEYPVQIQTTGVDLTSMMMPDDAGKKSEEPKKENKESDIKIVNMISSMFSSMDTNDLKSLKTYLDRGKSGIEDYTNAIEYSYNVVPQIYAQNEDGIRQVHPDRSFESMGFGSSTSSNSMMSVMMSTDVFYPMPENETLYKDQYDVKAGRWPEKYNECILVLSEGGAMSDFELYTLGLRDPMELDEMVKKFLAEEKVESPEYTDTYTYEDIVGKTFKLVNSSDYYQYDDQYHVWKDKTGDQAYMENLVDQGEIMTVVGVVQPSKDAKGAALYRGLNYLPSLTKHVAAQAERSQIVKEQRKNPKINVFTGEEFGEDKKEKPLDMNSLVTVDESKLQQAFSFDEKALSNATGSMDLSNLFGTSAATMDLSSMLDLSKISVSLPEMPQMNLSEFLKDLKLEINKDGFKPMATSLMEGYQIYVQTHPEADYSGIANDFSNYLQTPEAQEILKKNLGEIIQSGDGMAVTAQQIQKLMEEIIAGYGKFVTENGYHDPEQFDAYLAEYLQTAEAQTILNRYAAEIFQGIAGNVKITTEQIQKLSKELAAGYGVYAKANGLPDPTKMGEHFLNYLATEDGQKRLSDGIAGIVNVNSLEQQLTGVFANYMKTVSDTYGLAIGTALQSQIQSAMGQIMNQLSTGLEGAFGQMMMQVGNGLQNAMHIDGTAFASAFQMNMTGEELTELMMSMNPSQSATYENNLKKLGFVDFDVPLGISIYPKDFASKEEVVRILNEYNTKMEEAGKEEQVISYTDMVGTLMSSVTTIIDVISYVLIAFVAISLVVSSIMIGVITYISVLERKKEIGILRAIGASKKNISQVFNAETFIIGLCSGALGIGITLLLLIPANALIHHLAGTTDINAVLPVIPAMILILLSVLLTLVGGLLPSKKAAKSDPVLALRTD